MTSGRPFGFWILLVLASGLSACLLVLAIRQPATSLLVMAAFFVTAALIELAPARINTEISVSLVSVVQLAAIGYAGLGAAVAAGVGAGLIAGLSARHRRLEKIAMNVGMLVLAGAGGAFVFGASTGSPPFAVGVVPYGTLIVGLALAALAVQFINTGLLALVVHLTSGVPIGATIRQIARDTLIAEFLYVGIAAIAVILLRQVGLVSLVLLTVPLAVARRSLLSVQEQQEAYDRMVRAFVKAIELKDGYTRGHAERVSDLSVLVAERMGLSYEDRQLIRYGAILHDVGKIGVSLGILCKAGPLDDDEFAEMKLHPEIGAEMLADIDFLKPALAIVHHHHERMDGRGYPAGLAGDEIPVLTRVVTAVDAFDAMTSTRSYRRALPVAVALEELRAHAGTQFDAEVVGHLVAVIDEEGWQVTDEPVAVASASGGVPQVVLP